jgi:hypothetical protein
MSTVERVFNYGIIAMGSIFIAASIKEKIFDQIWV